MTTLSELPAGVRNAAAVVALVTERLYTVAGTARAIHDNVDADDRPRPTCCTRSLPSWRSRPGC